MEGEKRVSVIMPTYNEEKNIAECLDSLVKQTFCMKKVDFIVVDGLSKDGTLSIVNKYKDDFNIRIFFNEKRKAPYALNIGIDNAIGDYIIRMDAHSVYAPDYIEKCVYYLDTMDADNVGGVAITKGKGFWGEINADILSSKFGVGGSKFRTNGESGYVDTVPFGAFKRTVFEKLGKFNPDLPRSEDNDMNSRIRESGGKVYLASDIKFIYYCRDTVYGLLGQAIKNGNALFFTLKYNKRAMSMRHFIPFFFTISLLLLIPLSFVFRLCAYFLALEACAYLLLDIFFSLCEGRKKYFVFKFLLYPVFHFTYGLGSILSLIGIKLY